jgi:hypothetical protein
MKYNNPESSQLLKYLHKYTYLIYLIGGWVRPGAVQNAMEKSNSLAPVQNRTPPPRPSSPYPSRYAD